MKIREPEYLYCRYQGQTSPQPCYVELDCEDDTLTAAYNGEIGNAVPITVWHNRCLRWPIPALREGAALELLTELLPICERIVAGYESVWDGSNHVGKYTDAAEDAASEAHDLCRDAFDDTDTHLQVWEAGDWLAGLGTRALQAEQLGITATMSDAELELKTKKLEEEAGDDGIDEVEGLESYLSELRDVAREDICEAEVA
jgi:hypothetical protein